jgi:hypothetical protein
LKYEVALWQPFPTPVALLIPKAFPSGKDRLPSESGRIDLLFGVGIAESFILHHQRLIEHGEKGKRGQVAAD